MQLSPTLCNFQSVSVTDSLCPSQTVCVYHTKFLSVTECLCLSQRVCVCQQLSVSLTASLCLSQTVFICHRQSVYVTDSLFLSQTVCFSVTDRLCVSQKVSVCQCLSLSVTLLDNSGWGKISVSLEPLYQRHKKFPTCPIYLINIHKMYWQYRRAPKKQIGTQDAYSAGG